MGDFCFVILHYQNREDTEKCVNSILSLKNKSKIVIVDNLSPNGSGSKLADKYKEIENIHVLFNQTNAGFARGNNQGYKWAKENWAPAFIACINNDTIVEDSGFISKIEDYYVLKPFEVLGVDIYNPITGNHQSPIRERYMTAENLAQEFKRIRRHLIIIRLKQIKYIVKWPFRQTKKNIKSSESTGSWNVECEGAVIHGAAVIFSERYIQEEDTAFDSDTFLYYEEDLLACRCSRKGYVVRYYPQIQILHYEGKSTSAISNTVFEKDLFRIRQSRESLRILRQRLIGVGEDIKK